MSPTNYFPNGSQQISQAIVFDDARTKTIANMPDGTVRFVTVPGRPAASEDFVWNADGTITMRSLIVGAPVGGNQGVGTVNAKHYYKDGVEIGASSSLTSVVGTEVGAIPFVGADLHLAEDAANLFWDQANKVLVIGPNPTPGALDAGLGLWGDGSTTFAQFQMFTLAPNDGPAIIARSTRGTLAAPTASQDGDILFDLIWKGATGDDNISVAGFIEAAVDGTPSASAVPSRIVFSTSDLVGINERLRIDSAGTTTMGSGTSQFVDVPHNGTEILILADDGTNDPGFVNLQLVNYGGHDPKILSRALRGSPASPTAVAQNDILFLLNARGYDGTDFPVSEADMWVEVSGPVSAGVIPTDFVFYTSSTSGTLGESARITNGRKVNAVGGFTHNGTAISTVTLKTGSGAGDYTTTSATYADIDATNLSYTVTIPTGFKLLVNAVATIKDSSLAAAVGFAITDSSVIVEQLTEAAVAADRQTFALTHVITGNGASHTVKLQWKTSAGTATMSNSSATLSPRMTFLMVPSA